MPPSAPRLATRLLITALAYFIVGHACAQLASPLDNASPLYLAAGVALACVLGWGQAMAAGVAAGGLGVMLAAAWPELNGDHTGALLLNALVSALGGALQALGGAALLRRFVSRPLALDQPADVARFLLIAGPVAGTVNAVLSTASMVGLGLLPPALGLSTGLTWWAGDTLGALVGTPMVLTFVGQPADVWRPRRWTVGVPLAFTALLLVAGINQIQRWDAQRAQAVVSRDAGLIGNNVMLRLRGYLDAMEALRGLLLASGEVSREQFARAAEPWLSQLPDVTAMGWQERLPAEEVPAFEARQRDEGLTGFKVYSRSGAPLLPGEDVIVVRYVVPMNGNAPVLGLNSLSTPGREAVQRARRLDRPVASPSFRLVQETGDQLGIVIYRALYRGSPATEGERLAATRGTVFLALRLDDTLLALSEGSPTYMRTCLVDVTPGNGAAVRLAGEPYCEVHDGGPLGMTVIPLTFAERRWELRVWAYDPVPVIAGVANTWLFAVTGVMFAAALGALLLVMTGRTRRTEEAVLERTRQLEVQIAERLHTERALRASEQRLRGIFDNVPIGVVYTDLTGLIQQANPGLCELIGVPEPDLVGRPLDTLARPQDRAAQQALFQRVLLDQPGPTALELRYPTGSGAERTVRLRLSLLHEGGPGTASPQGLVGVIEDVTERVQLEEAQRARETAEAANRAKNEFLSRMSHELRTPLNAMLGFAQLMELDTEAQLPNRQRGWVEQIQRAGWHLLEMINDVLDLSRIDSGTLRLLPQPLDAHEAVEAARVLVEPEARRRSIHLECPPAGERGPRVLADPTRLKQILINLLSNAIKYNRDGGGVRVRLRAAGEDSLAIDVADDGLGMSPAQLADLFQPFNRLGRERSAVEGTGIGLVISRRLAELMGGTLQARSIEGQGSVFTLTLPVAPEAETFSPTLQDAAAAEPPMYRPRRVLYIEDNAVNAEVMRGIFAQRPQVRLDVRATAEEGLALLAACPPGDLPNLLLLDMHLPDGDGLGVLARLKADPHTADLPVVVVSADVSAGLMDAARRAGALDYLAKPVNVGELLRLIDGLLEPAETRY
ncbi:MAG: CHASE domain-containing protein [Pseudomonadota bacterium]